jgi:hypothetical protein
LTDIQLIWIYSVKRLLHSRLILILFHRQLDTCLYCAQWFFQHLGVTNCYDQLAVNWLPSMLAESQPLTGGSGVTGELGITERTIGGNQVTYNGWPLYYWLQDTATGDKPGYLVNNVWFIATPNDQITHAPATTTDEGDSNY